jgi:hypothetical protein
MAMAKNIPSQVFRKSPKLILAAPQKNSLVKKSLPPRKGLKDRL